MVIFMVIFSCVFCLFGNCLAKADGLVSVHHMLLVSPESEFCRNEMDGRGLPKVLKMNECVRSALKNCWCRITPKTSARQGDGSF